MTEKPPPRRFGGRTKSKAEQLGQMRGIEQAANVLDAPASADSGDMRQVPIDEVRVDPNNPRCLGIEWEMLQKGSEAFEDPVMRAEIEAIYGLAQTIRKEGQRSPIEVYRNGGVKRIVFGERRYWAVRLAELSTVKAIVLRTAPENVPLIQLIENIQHRQMPLYETILNIRMVVEREAEIGQPVKDATDLMERTGLGRASAYRYFRYVELPADVEGLLESRIIATHDDLTALLKHDTVAKRKEAIANYLADGSMSLAPTPDESPPRPKSRSKGRPKTTISLGSTRNPSVARHLLRKLDPKGDYESVDWEDIGSVATAWKGLLDKLELEFSGKRSPPS